MPSLYRRRYFFDDGIFFQCRQCGRCCNGSPGIVRVTGAEILGIAEFLTLSPSAFESRYLFAYEDGFSIREDETGRCLFYENGCRVYPVRPLQCQSFPFWFTNLRSHEKWLETVKVCPGIGTGHFFSRNDILNRMFFAFWDSEKGN
jgi:uncharacterized protein